MDADPLCISNVVQLIISFMISMINFPSHTSLIEFTFFAVHDCKNMDFIAGLFFFFFFFNSAKYQEDISH